MRIICPKCLELREVKATIGRYSRLDCRHLVITPLTEEEQKEKEKEIEEEKKEIQEIEQKIEEVKSQIEIDPNSFHNRKTKDIPYQYQIEGINFAIKSGFRCLIADEQGLGKTVQILGVMHYAMKYHYDDFFPCLIVPPSSVKKQWLVQLFNWCGVEFLPQIIESGKTPPVLGFNVYIASYDIFRRFSKKQKVVLKSAWGHEIESEQNENPFYDFPFKTIIMDEVQAIKGDSQRTAELKKICQGKNILALSGTPIKNSAAEYYNILHILSPEKFPSQSRYLTGWVKSEWIGGYEKFTGLKNPERFAEYTSDIIIRRTREEVKDEIGLRVTKANRIFYHVDFENPKLKAAYEAAEMEFIRQMENDTRDKAVSAVTKVAQLSLMRHLVGLNKIQPTVDLAIEFLLENTLGKLVIFVHHEDVMKTIEQLLAKWCLDGGYHVPLLFHSGLNQNERFEIIKAFAENKIKGKDEGHIPFIIGSTLAMGEGVDRLQEVCNDCIIAERQWNPANEEQAESRLVRIGQKKGFVNATYPIATDTIDEYFTDIVETKRKAMKETLEGKTIGWDEAGLLQALYEAIALKGRKKTKKGF